MAWKLLCFESTAFFDLCILDVWLLDGCTGLLSFMALARRAAVSTKQYCTVDAVPDVLDCIINPCTADTDRQARAFNMFLNVCCLAGAARP